MRRVEKLSIKELTELRNIVRTSKNLIEIKRAQAIMLVNDNSTKIVIESITGYSKSFASALRKKYRKNGIAGIKAKPKKTKNLLTEAQRSEIKQIVPETTPKDHGIEADFWTIPILAAFIQAKYRVTYKSKTSYQILFKQAQFTYHKPEKRYHNRKQDVLDRWNKETVPLIKQELQEIDQVVLTGDEMILTTQTTTQKIWLPSKKTIIIEASNKREKRCIFGFLNVKTGAQYAFKTEATNSTTTCKILKKLMLIYPNQKIVIVWDNATWNKSKEVRNFLTEHPGKFQLYSFPPYYPEENPQEHVWKAGRSKVTHNVFIDKIDNTADQFVAYLNQSKFEYKFL